MANNKPSLEELYTKSTKPSLDELYSGLRNEDQSTMADVEKPVDPAQAVVERRAGHPDLMQAAMDQVKQRSQSLVPNPMSDLGLAATTVGAGLQRVSAIVANTGNQLLGDPAKVGQGNWDPTIEIGDVGVGLGMPETMAATIGLITDPAAKITGAAKAIDMMGSKIAAVTGNLAKAGIKKTLPTSARILFNKPMEETEHLVNNPDVVLNTANLKADAPQKLANQMARDIAAVGRTGSRLYKQAARNSANIDLTPEASFMAGDELANILSSEPDAALKQRILNIPISKAPTTKTKVTQTYEPNFYENPQTGEVSVAPKLRQDIASTGLTDEGVKTGEKVSATDVPGFGPVINKITKSSEQAERAGAPVTGESTYTLGTVLERVKLGRPVSTAELVAARNALQKMRETSSTAGAMSDSLLQRLAEVDPTYRKANTVWRDYRRAEDYGKELFGGIFKDPRAVNKGARVTAITGGGDKLSSFHTNPNTPLSNAPAEIDAILGRNLKKTADYGKRVPDIAAATGMGDIRPRLFGSTIGGWGLSMGAPAAAAVGLGAINPALSVIPILAAAGAIPRVNALLIAKLSANKLVNPSTAKFLASPAGKFLIEAKAASGNAARNAALRGATGMNNQQEQEQ